jgi:hypothetical protein
MTRTSRSKKQHKPIGYPRSVEGHRNAVNEARDTREYNKRMKEIDAEGEANEPLTAKLADWWSSESNSRGGTAIDMGS